MLGHQGDPKGPHSSLQGTHRLAREQKASTSQVATPVITPGEASHLEQSMSRDRDGGSRACYIQSTEASGVMVTSVRPGERAVGVGGLGGGGGLVQICFLASVRPHQDAAQGPRLDFLTGKVGSPL